jgi:hypothetical protein
MIKCVVYTLFGLSLAAYDFAAARYRDWSPAAQER